MATDERQDKPSKDNTVSLITYYCEFFLLELGEIWLKKTVQCAQKVVTELPSLHLGALQRFG